MAHSTIVPSWVSGPAGARCEDCHQGAPVERADSSNTRPERLLLVEEEGVQGNRAGNGPDIGGKVGQVENRPRTRSGIPDRRLGAATPTDGKRVDYLRPSAAAARASATKATIAWRTWSPVVHSFAKPRRTAARPAGLITIISKP
jgi:hypothetical protein